jgi:hypothetical protein
MAFIDEYLTRLEGAGLIRVAQLEPELEYLFRHEMIRDAIYTAMLKQSRKELHQAAGEAIETLYPDRIDDIAPVLAYHFGEADHPDKALKYATLAGDISRRRFANMEAAVQYARALDLAKRHNQHDKLVYLFEQLGHALEHTGRHAEAVANYEDMRAVAREAKDRPMELQAMLMLLTIRATPTSVYDTALAHALGDESLRLAREQGDRQSEAVVLWNLCNMHSHTAEYAEAVRFGEESIAISRELKAREQLAYALNDLASFAYINNFQLERGKIALAEARQLWIDLDEKPMLSDCLNTAARYDAVMGNFDKVIRQSGEALQIAESIDNPWGQSYSHFATGDVYFALGDFDAALREINECLAWGERAGFVAPQGGPQANLGVMYGLLGQPRRGIEFVNRALETTAATLVEWRGWPLGNLFRLQILAGDLKAAAKSRKELHHSKLTHFLEAGTALKIGEIEYEMAVGKPAEAERYAVSSVEDYRRASANAYLAAVLPMHARALIAQGKSDEARASLLEARMLAEKMNARWELWQIYALLAEVEPANKAALLRQSREIVDYISAHISDAKLRRSFLALPAVKTIKKPVSKSTRKA